MEEWGKGKTTHTRARQGCMRVSGGIKEERESKDGLKHEKINRGTRPTREDFCKGRQACVTRAGPLVKLLLFAFHVALSCPWSWSECWPVSPCFVVQVKSSRCQRERGVECADIIHPILGLASRGSPPHISLVGSLGMSPRPMQKYIIIWR